MKRNPWIFTIAAGAAAIAPAAAQTPTQLQFLDNDPTFVTNTVLPAPLSTPVWPFVATGDIDGDGDTDVVSGLTYTENGTVLSASGPTFGVFTTNSTCAIDPFIAILSDGVLADLDGDGLPEFIAVGNQFLGSSSMGIWANVPGTCTKRKFVDARSPAGGGWSFSLPALGESVVLAADFDGDGDRDILLGGPNGVRMLLNEPSPSGAFQFVNAVASLPGVAVSAFAAADLDGDLDLDLAIGGGAPGAGVRFAALNNGAGTFTASPAPFVGGAAGFPLCVKAADVDADGDPDLVYGHQARVPPAGTAFIEGGLQVFTNNGAGVFTFAQAAGVITSFTDVAIGDLDEDGLVDIVACTDEEAATIVFGQPNILTTSGTRMFSRPAAGAAFADLTATRIASNPAQPANPIIDAVDWASPLSLDGTGIALADLDLDLDLDVVVSYRLAQGVGIFTNLLWQLETPRVATFVQIPPTTADADAVWTLAVPYDVYCEFNVPNVGVGVALAVVGVSLTPPQHLFPATGIGYATSGASYVFGPTIVVTGQGQFVMNLGPFDSATMSSLIGTRLFAQSGIVSIGRNLLRISNVVETLVQ